MGSLCAGVGAADSRAAVDAAPVLSEVIAVRHRLGDLDSRRQFDGAYVVDRTASGTPRGVALSASHAWIADIAASLEVAGDINTALSAVANSVADYKEGLDGEAGRELLVELAVQGSWLHLHLIEPLGDGANRPDIADKEYLRSSVPRASFVPFNSSMTAWRRTRMLRSVTLAQASEANARAPAGTTTTVCPMGFWGLRKVIERHQGTASSRKRGRNSSSVRADASPATLCWAGVQAARA
jgi:hypothetical protein